MAIDRTPSADTIFDRPPDVADAPFTPQPAAGRSLTWTELEADLRDAQRRLTVVRALYRAALGLLHVEQGKVRDLTRHLRERSCPAK